ncbi:ATP-dependent DNA ligase [Paenibacillus tarimensis]|uniref:ATP-dependent DNA ligase n=1 Tax=Paenibacillus tarimensis TaxID=416012 RepID=UPI001F391D26|nr:RNA ligase family protein [Paenibacillus tarimensis]MCF2945985.1 DNA ligase [Paenibacillus tarimensis]
MAGKRNTPPALEGAAPAAAVSTGTGWPPLPAEPMAPIREESLPAGSDWCYQLKWDGVRMLARLDGAGGVELYSKQLLAKNSTYPELAAMLKEVSGQLGSCLLDGELVYWDSSRPVFQKVLQRERMRGPGRQAGQDQHGLLYVLFDLLHDQGRDLRSLPYEERYRLLQKKWPKRAGMMLVTDMFDNGQALWQWVEKNGWEGVVSKRKSSPYREGKKHRDWLKKKTALLLEVNIVGIKLRDNRVASLIMALDGSFIGSVSLGLNEQMKQLLLSGIQAGGQLQPTEANPLGRLPQELKGENVVWLKQPFVCTVTGLEMTSAGLLRHPQLAGFGRQEGR